MSKSWDCFMDSFVNVVMPDDYCPDDNPMPLIEKALEEYNPKERRFLTDEELKGRKC